jgi:acyl-CoA reductase-like NAD-dependent aldehyde dehydrogenase
MNIHSSTIEAAFSFISVKNPFDGVEVGTVVNIPPDGVQMLIDSAKEGARACRSLSRHERARVLEACASMVERDKDTFADLIVAEAGKTIRQAKREVLRCVNTLKLSADEARRNGGEVVPFDAYAGSENRQGWFTREPLGIVVAITPYNDPLNLVAHKLGPAIAGGNAVVLKPSELAPLSAIKLVNYLVAAGMPSNIVSVATGGGPEVQNRFVANLRLITSAVSLGHDETLIVHVGKDGRGGSECYPDVFREYGHLRLSIGLEDPGDLIADISAALEETFD